MSEVETELFDHPRRQHVLGLLGYFTKNLYVMVKSFWPVAAGLAFSGEVMLYASLIVSVLLGLVVLSAVLEFLFFKFHLSGDQMVVHRGLWKKERLVIPFDRIQAVHLQQSAWQQLFGLTGLRVDTAGGTGSELDFRALKKTEAIELRSILTGVTQKQTQGDSDRPLMALDMSKLFKVGLTQNHLRNGAIALGALVTVFEPLNRMIEAWLESAPVWTGFVISLFGFLLIIPGVILFVFLAVLASLVTAVISYYKMRVDLEGDELSLESGLLKRNEFRIPLHKIQLLVWKSTWLRRQLQLETLQIHQAKAQAESGLGALALNIPGLEHDQSQRILEAVFPRWNLNRVEQFKPVKHMRYRLFAAALLPLIPLFVVGGMGLVNLMIAVLWILFRWYSTGRKYESIKATSNEAVLVVKSGWWFRKRVALQWHQLQRVSFHQNMFHKRRGIAHVGLHTAAGSQVLRFLPEADAHRIVNYSLYCIENHKGAWM